MINIGIVWRLKLTALALLVAALHSSEEDLSEVRRVVENCRLFFNRLRSSSIYLSYVLRKQMM